MSTLSIAADLQSKLIYSSNTEITDQELLDMVDTLMSFDWSINKEIINLKKRGWSFQFNSSKSAIGQCRSNGKTIFLSESFWKANKDLSAEWEDTIRHEIAHAIDYEIRKRSDHGPIWKSIAVKVLCHPSSRSDQMKNPEGKYKAICPKCGAIHYMHKRSRRTLACHFCCTKYNGGKFSREYRLDFFANTSLNNKAQSSRLEEKVAPTQIKKKEAKKSKHHDAIEALWREGKTGYLIAKELGIYTSQVYPIIKKLSNV